MKAMSEHYKTLSIVCPIFLKVENDKKQVLLARRANTGYMDGMWDFAGTGHVDGDETAMQAVVRESREEIGVTVESCDINFVHLSHRLGKSGSKTYYDIYFSIDNFSGEPIIAEPTKCSDLKWFDIEFLPSDMIDIRKSALQMCLKSVYYSEITTV